MCDKWQCDDVIRRKRERERERGEHMQNNHSNQISGSWVAERERERRRTHIEEREKYGNGWWRAVVPPKIKEDERKQGKLKQQQQIVCVCVCVWSAAYLGQQSHLPHEQLASHRRGCASLGTARQGQGPWEREREREREDTKRQKVMACALECQWNCPHARTHTYVCCFVVVICTLTYINHLEDSFPHNRHIPLYMAGTKLAQVQSPHLWIFILCVLQEFSDVISLLWSKGEKGVTQQRKKLVDRPTLKKSVDEPFGGNRTGSSLFIGGGVGSLGTRVWSTTGFSSTLGFWACWCDDLSGAPRELRSCLLRSSAWSSSLARLWATSSDASSSSPTPPCKSLELRASLASSSTDIR